MNFYTNEYFDIGYNTKKLHANRLFDNIKKIDISYHADSINSFINFCCCEVESNELKSNLEILEKKMIQDDYQILKSTLLHHCCCDTSLVRHCLELIEYLINSDTNIEYKSVKDDDENYRFNKQDLQCATTPFFEAARCGAIEICKLLLNKGANINTRRASDNRGILHEIVSGSGYDIIPILRFFVENGADVKAIDKDKISILGVAAQYGDYEVCRLLIEEWNADVNPLKVRQPINYAIKNGHIDVIRLLVDHGASISLNHCAAAITSDSERRTEVLRLLLEKSNITNLNKKINSDGHTLLTLSAAYGYTECCRVLVSRGANIETKSSQGCTPLLNAVRYAIYNNKSTACARTLLELGANIDSKDSISRTPLFFAIMNLCDYADLEVVKMLLKFGASVHHATEDGYQALHCAAFDIVSDDETFSDSER